MKMTLESFEMSEFDYAKTKPHIPEKQNPGN